MPHAIRQIAQLIGVNASERDVQRVAERASLERMQKSPHANIALELESEGQKGKGELTLTLFNFYILQLSENT